MIVNRIGERVKFWRSLRFCHLELLHARHITHTFGCHIYDTYAIGVIEQGAEACNYQGLFGRCSDRLDLSNIDRLNWDWVNKEFGS